MTDCDRTLGWLLEVEPGEVGAPPTPLAEHLETCAACSENAETLEAGRLALAASLSDPAVPFSEERAVQIALGRGSTYRAERVSGRWAAGARRWRWAPVPIAAAAALLVLTRAPADPGSGSPGAEALRPDAANSFAFAVTAAEDTRVAVFQTENPRIRVVWLY